MFEVLLSLSQKKQAIEYPFSGPGSKFLIKGNETLGYFGLVDSKDIYFRERFIEQADIADYTNSIVGSFANQQWVKYFWMGKVCFAPLSIYMTNVSWKVLYDKGLVFGDNTIGQNIPSGYNTVQDKFYHFTDDEGSWQFRIRMGHLTENPFTPTNNEDPTSELGQVFTRVTNGSWDNRPTSVIGLGNGTWTKALNTAQRPMYQFYNTSITSVNNNAPMNNGIWRPVLELIPKDEYHLVPIETTINAYSNLAEASIITNTEISSGGIQPIIQLTSLPTPVSIAYISNAPQDETLIDLNSISRKIDKTAEVRINSFSFT